MPCHILHSYMLIRSLLENWAQMEWGPIGVETGSEPCEPCGCYTTAVILNPTSVACMGSPLSPFAVGYYTVYDKYDWGMVMYVLLQFYWNYAFIYLNTYQECKRSGSSMYGSDHTLTLCSGFLFFIIRIYIFISITCLRSHLLFDSVTELVELLVGWVL